MNQSNSPRFMSLVRSKIRVMQYSHQTEKSYVYWIKHFIHFNNLRHPKEMGASEVTEFLTYLAVHKKVTTHVLSRNQTGTLSPLDKL